jgi:hypothetical protein
MYCDQHVIKILLEITQMLYTAWHCSGFSLVDPPLSKNGQKGYRPAHKNHPMCMWVRQSKKTYMFTVRLGMALALEYALRFKKCHACAKHVMWLHTNVPPVFYRTKSPKAYYGKLGVPQCMPPEHQQFDPVLAYRSYYETKKTFARWTKRNALHFDKKPMDSFLERMTHVSRKDITLLRQKEVVQWLYGDLSFLPSDTNETKKFLEDRWGQETMKVRRPDLKMDKQWTGLFGEYICEELYTLLGKAVTKPVKKEGYQPDLETEDYIIEVKTGTYNTSGTAGEKILGCPFKYCDIPRLYGKNLKIVCIGGAEQACKKYGNLPGENCSEQKQKFLDFFSENGIEYMGITSDLLSGPHSF